MNKILNLTKRSFCKKRLWINKQSVDYEKRIMKNILRNVDSPYEGIEDGLKIASHIYHSLIFQIISIL